MNNNYNVTDITVTLRLSDLTGHDRWKDLLMKRTVLF